MYLPRLTFLSHFVLCLACAGLVFFAWANGVPQTIWTNDMSMMTSVIGALFVGSAIRLGGKRGELANQRRTTEDASTHTPLLFFLHHLIMVIWLSDFASWRALSAPRSAFLCRLSRSPVARPASLRSRRRSSPPRLAGPQLLLSPS